MIEDRPWGRFQIIYQDEYTWLKKLTIDPGQSLSYQYHTMRWEYWMPCEPGLWSEIEGEHESLIWPRYYPLSVKPRTKHRLYNPGTRSRSVLEWATGRPDESDIVRIRDNYGR